MQIETIIAFVFWAIIYLLIHSYLIYPFTLVLISLFKKRLSTSGSMPSPTVSILISAYNEDLVIEERIENIRSLEYDFSKIELLVGSDCSSDKTDKILIELKNKYGWLKVKSFPTRRGKASVLNDLASEAQHDILVFTDANTKFETNSLAKVVEGFNDGKIGGVCGRLVLEEPLDGFNQINREKLYWKYETFLKKFEGLLGILIGANGGIFAVRKKLFKKFPLNEAVTDDLYQTLAVHSKGYKFTYSFDAIAYEEISKELKTEFKRKVRFAATNFQTLKNFTELLINKNILLSYAFWSHKVLRWLVPVMLIILFLTNIFLTSYSQIYLDIFIIQLIFYSLAVLGFFLSTIRINIPVVGIIYYYVVTNIALLMGFVKFLFKKHSYIWESTPR